MPMSFVGLHLAASSSDIHTYDRKSQTLYTENAHQSVAAKGVPTSYCLCPILDLAVECTRLNYLFPPSQPN